MPLEDVPISTAIAMFTESLPSAVMVSVTENDYTNQLETNLGLYAPSIDAKSLVSGGATAIRSEVPQALFHTVLFAYDKVMDQMFYVGVAWSCCSILGVLGLEWLSVKSKKIEGSNSV